MQRKIIAAVCASYAHALTTEKARRSPRWEKPAHIIEQERLEAEKAQRVAEEAQRVAEEARLAAEREAERKRLAESIPVDPYAEVSSSENGHGCSYAHERTKKAITTDLN